VVVKQGETVEEGTIAIKQWSPPVFLDFPIHQNLYGLNTIST